MQAQMGWLGLVLMSGLYPKLLSRRLSQRATLSDKECAGEPNVVLIDTAKGQEALVEGRKCDCSRVQVGGRCKLDLVTRRALGVSKFVVSICQ